MDLRENYCSDQSLALFPSAVRPKRLGVPAAVPHYTPPQMLNIPQLQSGVSSAMFLFFYSSYPPTGR